MNWQCPRCETFNRSAAKYCEVCELSKPKGKPPVETIEKKTSLKPLISSDTARNGSLTKSADITPGFKVVDRRSSATIKTAAEDKTVATKKPDAAKVAAVAPPDIQPSPTPGGAVTDVILTLLLIAFNIYYIYQAVVVLKTGILGLIVGLIISNLIVLAVLGGILEVIKAIFGGANSSK